VLHGRANCGRTENPAPNGTSTWFWSSFWPEASLPNGLLRTDLGDPLAFSMDGEKQNQQMLEHVVRTFGRQVDNLEIGEKFRRAMRDL